jgi:hypothetical protein
MKKYGMKNGKEIPARLISTFNACEKSWIGQIRSRQFTNWDIGWRWNREAMGETDFSHITDCCGLVFYMQLPYHEKKP